MSVARGDPLRLRLFICGEEVPVIAGMVSATEGSPAAAQIEIVPTDRALRLLPRSKVHLFHLDYDQAAHVGDPDDDEGADGAWGLNDLYKLLFSGELFTINYTKTGYGSRSIVLQCLDDSNLWDTSYLYLLRYSNTDTGDNAFTQDTHVFMGAAAAADDILSGPELTVSEWASNGVSPYSPGLQGVGGLIGGLFSVLELVGGLKGKYVGLTAWHTIQEARVRLMDQLAGDSGETSKKLYDLEVFQNWLTSRLGDRGTVISFRDIIGMVNQYIFYSVVPNPVGRYIPGERNPPKWPAILAKGGAGGLQPEFEEVLNRFIKEMQKTYPSTNTVSGHRSVEQQTLLLMRRPGMTEAEARRKAKNYPHVSGYAADIGGHGAVGIGYVTMQKGYTSKDSFLGKGIGEYSIHKKCQYYVQQEETSDPEVLRGYLTDEEVTQLTIAVNFFNHMRGVLADFPELKWLGDEATTVDPMWAAIDKSLKFDPVHIELRGWQGKAGSLFGSLSDFEKFVAELPPRERLLTQYFRPDCWFVVPPACNVIFPEEVTSFSFSRQMMRETTRLQLMTHNTMLGESAILNQSFFAPHFQNTKSLTSGGNAPNVKEQVIYPHEKFTGIIPKMERLSDVAIYARLTEEDKVTDAAKQINLTKAKTGDDAVDAVETMMDAWAARTAAFNFLSHRYASRMCTVAGRFMPRLVCGFPALIIDKPAIGATVDENNKIVSNAQLPLQFVGMVRSLSHSLSQSGGTTTVTLSHARSHKNYDETDGLPDDLFSSQVTEARVFKKAVQVTLRMSDADFATALELQKVLAPALAALQDGVLAGQTLTSELLEMQLTGPRGGEVSGLRIAGAGGVDFFAESETLADGSTRIPNADGFSSTFLAARRSAPREKVEVNFGAFQYTETVGEDGLILSLEDSITPPWFSDEYLSTNIGDLYEEFFGCGSMLELNGQPSVEACADSLAAEYGQRITGGGSTSEWIYASTRRGYATLGQVLRDDPEDPGFHTFASGSYEKGLDRLGLEPSGEPLVDGEPPTLTSPHEPETPRTLPKALDPRSQRHEKVRNYVAELSTLRGLRG